MTRKQLLLSSVVAFTAFVSTVAVAGPIENYSPVTSARLENPEPENWLMTRGNYQGWSYSPLDQINTSNVKHLVPVWSFSTGVDLRPRGAADRQQRHDVRRHAVQPGHRAGCGDRRPDLALQARAAGRLQRAAQHQPRRGAVRRQGLLRRRWTRCWSRSTPRPARSPGKAKVEDWHTGYYMTMAPLVVKGKVMVGVSGGEFGVRGFVQAFDAETGNPVWKTYTVPARASRAATPGRSPTPGRRGGASTWMTGNYDPETNMVYWGTGNGSPWFGDQRPGDNLYTSSTVALDGDTGEIKGHFQYHRNDSWDWDEMNAPMLVDFQKDGADDQGPAQAGAQRLSVLAGAQHGRRDQLRRRQGLRQAERVQEHRSEDRPADLDMDHKPGTGKEASFCPALWGGKDWPYEAYNPKTGMVYIPANENHCGTPGRQGGGVRGRPVVDRRVDPRHRLHGRQERELLRRDPGLGRQHRQARVAPSVSRLDDVGLDADHRWRLCSTAAPTTASSAPTTPGPASSSGTSDQLRHHRAAFVLRGRRRAVCRRAVRLGRRRRRSSRA